MEKNEKKNILNKIFNWFKGLTIKGLLGAILIAFIIIIILLSLSYLPNVASKLGSSLSAALYSIFVPASGASATIDKKIVASNEEFKILFEKDNGTDGLFTISYACDNSNLNLFSVESSNIKEIKCDQTYYLLDNETMITLKAINKGEAVRLAIQTAFENSETEKIEDIDTVRINIKGNGVSTKESSTESENNQTSNFESSSTIGDGQPDLAVRILQTGLFVNQNLLTDKTSFTNSDLIGVRFEVRNNGTANSGYWTFLAVLPSASTPIYSSGNQISLRPGDSMIFTLAFRNLTNRNSNLISINVDQQNLVRESRENNNIATASIIGRNSGNGSLEVTCYATPDDPEKGDRVRWHADVSGGDGDYDYEWDGSNNLDSSSKNPTKTYNTRGRKTATVTVESDNETAEDTCSVYVD